MDTTCENCKHFDDRYDFCEELVEHVHDMQSCNCFEGVSSCCGADVDEDYMICPVCKEHV